MDAVDASTLSLLMQFINEVEFQIVWTQWWYLSSLYNSLLAKRKTIKDAFLKQENLKETNTKYELVLKLAAKLCPYLSSEDPLVNVDGN